MGFKRIFKRGKKKKPENESRGSPSREDTSEPGASIWGASPTPLPSVAVSALVFQPFVSLPAPPPSEHRRTETTVSNTDTWTNLTAFLNLVHQAPVFAPIAEAMDDLSWFVRAHENAVTTRNEYKALRTQIEGLFKDLHAHFSRSSPPAMTTSMLNLCE
ncbi:unnamed protein product [Rhizoctonia solani]|uniref:Uncharacterized protein n=1 Tax=Rhizoctonia solani TaxID=456999 RepID=A0A8H2XW66_9AGAM|nr:unnamed protein product [Rhizoctonia solani]